MHNLEMSIQKVTRGDNSGLREIYNILGGAIYTQSYFITKDHYTAEDVSQEVFIKIMKSAFQYKKGTNPKAWIMRIAKNSAIDKLREKNMHNNKSLDDYIDHATYTKIQDKEKLDEKIDLTEEINKLDFDSQQIIVLHILVGLTFKEISNYLNVPLGTITWKYKTIIKEIKTRLIS